MTRHARRALGRGFFAVGIVDGKSAPNVGTLWRTASLYRAAFVFTVGRRYERQPSDTAATPRHVPLLHFADVNDLVDHLPHGCPLVGVELDPRAHRLDRFHHPDRAAYLLGAEDRGLTAAQRDRCHALVQIDAPEPWSMNVATAGAVLMYDRHNRRARLREPVP